MSGRTCDVLIIGGGLSGGLIALALHRATPSLSLKIIEAGESIGGNHRWSWFDTDLGEQGHALLAEFPTANWEGYEVHFPAHSRTLSTRYNSLASADFAKVLENTLPEGSILTGSSASGVDAHGATLQSGERIEAPVVIDCRGVTQVDGLRGGWQTFLGRHFRMEKPHGLERPIVMDARVEQLDGYRFVYVLPLSAHELFIEDTYYADRPAIDEDELSRRIDDYCASHGWNGEEIGRETGALPVITSGDFRSWQSHQAIEGVARAGARGGFVHPLTSYTLPIAAKTATDIANALVTAGRFKQPSAPYDGSALTAWIETRANEHWRSTRFYRRLGRMLFDAAELANRFRIFERFYRLPEGLIERFYGGRSTMFDQARILSGKPPVPVFAAMRALAGNGRPLASKDAQ